MSDDEDLTRLCQWCGRAFRLGTTGRRAVYCGRSCRELAYRERRTRRLIAQAVAQATAGPAARAVSSTDDRPHSDSTVDETESGQVGRVPAPALPDPGEGWVRSPDVVEAQLRELQARRAAVPPAPRVRRRLASPPPDAPTLFEPDGDSAGGLRGGASGTANDTHPGHGETGTDTE
ncbi:MAG: hypothetical protein HOY71_44595 [Nonomuraea sp.]|nr:hypothetical protein [Nonomuraea sp.]